MHHNLPEQAGCMPSGPVALATHDALRDSRQKSRLLPAENEVDVRKTAAGQFFQLTRGRNEYAAAYGAGDGSCRMVKRKDTCPGIAKILLMSFLAIPVVYASPAIRTATAAIRAARESWRSLDRDVNYKSPLYSKKEIAKFEPYTATLVDDVWVVRGTIPPDFHGQVIETTVQSDGTVSMSVRTIE
jgi:hypothetical protein